MFEIFTWAKLRRINEHRNNYHVAHSSRFTNETQVTIMQRTHRRNETNSAILFTANFARDGTHALTAVYDLHIVEGWV
jgi:hypothetical protein